MRSHRRPQTTHFRVNKARGWESKQISHCQKYPQSSPPNFQSLSLGKYIPIEAIIDILLANKNADIKRLQQENEELRQFIKSHGLTYEEKEKPVKIIHQPEASSGPKRSATPSKSDKDQSGAGKSKAGEDAKTKDTTGGGLDSSGANQDAKKKEIEDAKKAKDAEEARKAKEAEDARKAKEVEDARKAKEAEDARKTKEAEDARKAKEAEDANKLTARMGEVPTAASEMSKKSDGKAGSEVLNT